MREKGYVVKWLPSSEENPEKCATKFTTIQNAFFELSNIRIT